MEQKELKQEFRTALKSSGHDYSDEYLYDLIKQLQQNIVQLQNRIDTCLTK